MVNKDLLHRFIEQAMTDEQLQEKLVENPRSVLMDWGFGLEDIGEVEGLLEAGVPLEELGERISKYLFGGGGNG